MKSFRLEKQSFDWDWELIYKTGAWIVGIITSLGIWVYSWVGWGFLLGLMFGWIPAIIGGFVAGLLWPLVLVIFFILASLIFG